MKTVSKKVAEVRAEWRAEDALTLQELQVCKKLGVNPEEFLLQKELDDRLQKQRLAGEADNIQKLMKQSAFYLEQDEKQLAWNREFAKARVEGRTLVTKLR